MSEPVEPPEDNRRRVSDVMPAELDQVDFETPIAGLNVIDDQVVADTFRQASQDEGAKGNASTALVYGFLQAIGHTVDVRDVVEAVEKQISGKTLAEALFHLIGLHRSRDPASLRAGVMEQRKGSILASMFSTGLYDKSGKLKFQSPGLTGADQEDQEQTMRFDHPVGRSDPQIDRRQRY